MAHGEGELVITLESWEVTRASRRVEEGLSRSHPLGPAWIPEAQAEAPGWAVCRHLRGQHLGGHGCLQDWTWEQKSRFSPWAVT